jgi:DNA-binding NtrC family response regulator
VRVRPVVLIVDDILDQLDLYEMARHVLLHTASDALDLAARAIRAGATLLLHKPCTAERLALTIDAAIAPPEQGGAR